MVNDMTPQIIELGKASRRSALWGGFGLSVVAISLAVATWMLYRAANLLTLKAHALDVANTELDVARAELADIENRQRATQLDIDNLTADVATKTDELETALRQLHEIDDLAAKSERAAWVRQIRRPCRVFLQREVPPYRSSRWRVSNCRPRRRVSGWGITCCATSGSGSRCPRAGRTISSRSNMCLTS